MKVASDLKVFLKALDRIDKFGLGIPSSPTSQLTSAGGKLLKEDWKGLTKQAVSQYFFPRTIAQVAFNKELPERLLRTVGATSASAPQQTFLQRFSEQKLPALLYELGSAAQQRNQAGFGGEGTE